MRLVLASASPRRLELLRSLGIEPMVLPADVDETPAPGELPREAAHRLARAKAGQVARNAPEGSLIVGADTVVEVEGELLGKPRDDPDARHMLALLAGRGHQVHTGLAVLAGDRRQSDVATTEVVFAPLSPAEIDWYVGTGEPRDKAGAYAVQGRAALFVREVRGSYSNVVGLPVELLYRLCLVLDCDLKRIGGSAGSAPLP